jgi:hypothetical protein
MDQPDDAWARSHETAAALRRAFLMLGMSADGLDALTSRDDSNGRPRVHIPPMLPEDAQLILDGLTPALGPAALIGHRDAAPVLPRGHE